MERQQELAALQKEVLQKAAAHLQAVNGLPDEGAPDEKQLAEARRTQHEWQDVVKQLNSLLEDLLKAGSDC